MVSTFWEQLISLVRERRVKKECAFAKMPQWKTRLEGSLTTDHTHAAILPLETVGHSLSLSSRECSVDNLVENFLK